MNICSRVLRLREWGYATFVKPKRGDSDIDVDIVAYIRRREAEGDLREVLVASNDARAFKGILEELVARTGVAVTVLGFSAWAGTLARSETLNFIDLEEVEGLFPRPLPRARIDDLPDEGQWFEPLRDDDS